MSRNITRDDVARMPDSVRRQIQRQINEQASAALAKIKCRRCGDTGQIVTEDGGAECPACHRGRSSPTVGGSPIVSPGGGPRRPWSAATPTVVDGIRFPSKMEARVYERLRRELRPGEILLRQVRLPLLSIAPNNRGAPLALTIDFMIMRREQIPRGEESKWVFLQVEPHSGNGAGWGSGLRTWVRWIEAKGRRRSRDWARGKAAFEATWGAIQEVDR